uniref:LOW QUALITY PROTEIN: survival motor neuron protein-like n=1 Tax=Styela clava TaxID=7725 RepID=UPI001939BDF5|nr:LOW QUALITY PROTEIN: survival motor neuron protein-like [Styela clava]
MAAKKGEVIYRRPKIGFEDLDPESWTDLAICDAYDKAVNNETLVKRRQAMDVPSEQKRHGMDLNQSPEMQITETLFGQEGLTLMSIKPNKNNPMFSSDQVKNEPDMVWKVGDECVGLYYEDGLYYDCTIISINKKAGTCVVEYNVYGNRETVELTDLHDAEKWNNEMSAGGNNSAKDSGTSTSSSSFYTSNTTSSSTEGTSSDVTQDIYRSRGNRKKHTEKRKTQNNSHPFQNMRNMAPPSFTTDSIFAMPPQSFPTGHFPPFGPFPSTQSPKLSKLRDLSDDALSSMLMSWYMAGYHTGYYQGVNSHLSRKKRHK